MPNIFSLESIPVAEKMLSVVREYPNKSGGDPALVALQWGAIIEEIIDIDPANIEIFRKFADQECARPEFQLIGLLVPYLLDLVPEDRGDFAHFVLNDLDDEQYERAMEGLKKREASNK